MPNRTSPPPSWSIVAETQLALYQERHGQAHEQDALLADALRGLPPESRQAQLVRAARQETASALQVLKRLHDAWQREVHALDEAREIARASAQAARGMTEEELAPEPPRRAPIKRTKAQRSCDRKRKQQFRIVQGGRGEAKDS
jgi:hypothetical protein